MDFTSLSFWTDISDIVQGIGSLGSVIVAFYAVRLVQNYTREKDEADFIRNRWNEQAQVNLACMQNDDALAAHEEIVYGMEVNDRKESRKYFVIFTMLNQIQHLYIAHKHGVLDREEFEDSALQTIKLLKRNETLALYLLRERGYSEAFREVIAPLFNRATASQLPTTFIPPRPQEK